MKKFCTSIAFMLLILASVYGQFDATITITDEVTTLPLENVDVFLESQSGTTNASGQVTFTNLNDGTYQYTYVLDCYATNSEFLTIAGGNTTESAVMSPSTTNSVFFFVGSPLTLPGATVSLFDSGGYFETLTTGNFLGDIFENVPFGDYNYTIELDCYETIFGSVTVECLGGGQGVAVAENPVVQTTNSVFFFVGSPLTLPGATVSLFDSGGYFETLTTGNFLGDIFENVPFGDYNYTIELDCYETIFGSVTVECVGAGQGVVVAENPVVQTTNSVFFFVGSPLTLPGATVSLFDSGGYFETLTTGNFLGDIFENVPFGDYNYTIELDCYETIFGSVTVECVGAGQGVVVAENPVVQTTNSVFFFVGSPLTLPGATVSLFDSGGYFETLTTGNFLGDIFENVPFGDYNYTIELDCYETIFGSVTVECVGAGQGVVVAENPAVQTTNSVFFFVGSPLTLPGATVSLFDSGGYFETLTTGNFLGDIFENVPFGDYNYTIELDCYETIFGSVTVECVGAGQGVVVAENPVVQTTNSVFFFVGSPLTLPGATVSLFDGEGYFETLVTGNFLGDIFENVPFGDYNYTIEADCYETISGSVTVECVGAGQGVVVAENPVAIVLDTEVSLVDGNTLIASAIGVTYQWINCETGAPIEGATDQTYVASEAGEYAVIITQDNCSATSECLPIAAPCESPYPQVNPASLNATILPNGKLRFEWEPVFGQIGCQINIVAGTGPQQASIIISGFNASQFSAPVSQLVPFTVYSYRVRCGCSQNPLIVGQYTPYASVLYLPPSITEEMGDAYADSPLSRIDGDTQWSNANLGADLVGELFAMKASESWVRVAPNPAQDNVNLSYNSIKEGQGLIRVFDAQGKLAVERVMTFNEGLNNVNLNLNELENGMYIVEVLKGDSRESVRLLMQ